MICLDEGVEVGFEGGGVGLEDAIDGFPDGGEGTLTGEEAFDGDFVSGVKHRRVGATGGTGVACEVEGGEVEMAGRFKLEFCEGGEIK